MFVRLINVIFKTRRGGLYVRPLIHKPLGRYKKTSGLFANFFTKKTACYFRKEGEGDYLTTRRKISSEAVIKVS